MVVADAIATMIGPIMKEVTARVVIFAQVQAIFAAMATDAGQVQAKLAVVAEVFKMVAVAAAPQATSIQLVEIHHHMLAEVVILTSLNLSVEWAPLATGEPKLLLFANLQP